ncbi:hypothetical protein DNU06_10390 [Putridiphycobacter roseus]|uniref:RDD domain-containing protein n=1 Tax=Putridiphycobacter roseus TaxID=2219161 RepID=A0A2W1N2E3_9FLAO|nr:RDD family protein [Putridiphycobacter roseus]PZE17141.1 hypothetical protein DNU06_10390 [Putridiphycobacter roseus]
MKKVEILTANTIPIQYEAASMLHRGMALLLDFIVKIIYILIISLLMGLLFTGINLFGEESLSYIIQFVLIWIPITFYSLLLEYLLKGQTVGKLIMGIRVVSITGENAKINDYIMRWLFRIVDFWFSLGGIGAILIYTSQNSQRMGDILAQTIVIKNKSTQLYSIQDILNIKTKSNHPPTYLAVTQFTDEDMLILKNTITRYKRFPNEAHKAAILKLSDKMCVLLQIQEAPKKKIAFLRTILQDYIVLTRE